MTSKRILEHLYNASTIGITSKENEKILKDYYKVVLRDLNRLEKLERFVDIYKNTNQRFTMFIQSKSSNLPSPTLEQELLRKEVLENE